MWDNTVVKLNEPTPKLTKKIAHFVDANQYVDDWIASGSERELSSILDLYPEHISINDSVVNLYVNFNKRTYFNVMSFILTFNNLLYDTVSFTVMSPKWIAGNQQATVDWLSRKVVAMLTDADGYASYEPEVDRIYEIVSAIVDPDAKQVNLYSGFQAWMLPKIFKRIVQKKYHELMPDKDNIRSFPVNVTVQGSRIREVNGMKWSFIIKSSNIFEHFIKLALIHFAFRMMASCGYFRDIVFGDVEQFLEYGPKFNQYINTNSKYSVFKTLHIFFDKEILDELKSAQDFNISLTDKQKIEHMNTYTEKLKEMLEKPIRVNPLIA